MVKRSERPKLEFKPVTVYLKPEDHDWFKQHAADISHREGQAISMTNVVRRVLSQYKEKQERN
jgi:hypothetical protein